MNAMKDTELHLAVRKNRLDSALKLITKGFSVNAKNTKQETPLHLASRFSRTDIAYALLEVGSSPFARNRKHEKPLHVAAKYGHSHIVRLLLKYDWNRRAKNKDGFTPLDLAKRYCHSQTQALLEDKKQDSKFSPFARKGKPNIKNGNEQTALHIAAALESVGLETVKLLITNSSDINVKDRNGMTTLHLASMSGNEVKYCHHYSDQVVFTNDWWPLSQKSCPMTKQRYIEKVTLLLYRGADVNAKDKFHHTPLHCAAASGSTEIARLLLDRGATVNAEKDKQRRSLSCDDPPTALHYALASGKSQLVKLLLDRGINVNRRDGHGLMPLEVAVSGNIVGKLKGTPFLDAGVEIVKLLLNCGACANAKPCLPLLLYAAARGHIGVIQLLLDSGADLYARSFSDTFLHYAARHGHIEIVEHYFEKFAFVSHGQGQRMLNTDSETLHVKTESLEILVKNLIESPENLTTKNILSFLPDFDRETSLNQNADYGDFEVDTSLSETSDYKGKDIVDLLLEKNAIQHLVSERGETALHILASHMQTQTEYRRLETLLHSKEFNVNAMDFGSRTPLHLLAFCCECRYSNDKSKFRTIRDEAIRLLLKHGADPNKQEHLGNTALMMAIEKECVHIVDMLTDPPEEIAVQVDLDKQNARGETALIMAAKNFRTNLLKPLLGKGASVILRDNHGFSPLHTAAYRPNLDSIDSDGRRSGFERLRLLLNCCPDSAVNALDFCGNTVLDLTMKCSLTAANCIIGSLRERRCVTNTMSKHEEKIVNSEHQMHNCKTLHHIDPVDPNTSGSRQHPLNILTMITNPIFYVEKERRKLFNGLNRDEFLETLIDMKHKNRMRNTDTGIFKAVFADIHRHVYNTKHIRFTEENSCKYSRCTSEINDADEFGRTPLHYAVLYLGRNHEVCQWLIENGADTKLKDFYGFSVDDLFRFPANLKLLKNKRKLYAEVCAERKSNQFDECQMKIFSPWGREYREFTVGSMHIFKRKRISGAKTGNSTPSCTWRFWKEAQYAFKVSFRKRLTEEVSNFVKELTESLKLRDPRFESSFMLVGSAFEETKINLPDEYDFNIILTKFSQICEVVESTTAPKGYVHLKREIPSTQTVDNFDDCLNSDGFLICGRVCSYFKVLLYQTLAHFTHHLFEWNVQEFADFRDGDNFHSHPKLCVNFRLRMIRSIESKLFDRISVDVVPCIHIDGWWPEGGINEVEEKITVRGCTLIFDQPQRMYPWVPFTDPYAKISFAIGESALIKNCPLTLKAAYMVGKHILQAYRLTDRAYILKTALLFCIHVERRKLQENKRQTLNNYDDITSVELDSSMLLLMTCFIKLIVQGYYPSYFMPSFTTPYETFSTGQSRVVAGFTPDNKNIGSELVESFLKISDAMAIFLRPEVEFDFGVQLPLPSKEHFDRELFLGELCEQFNVIDKRVEAFDSIT